MLPYLRRIPVPCANAPVLRHNTTSLLNSYPTVKITKLHNNTNVQQYDFDNFGAECSNLVIESFLESSWSGASDRTLLGIAGVPVTAEIHKQKAQRLK